MVESIIAYSLSASSDRWLKTLSQTPLFAHRLNRVWIVSGSPNRSGKSRHGMPARERYSTASTKHGLHEQPVVLRGHADMALPPRQQILDAVPLVVAKGVASHRQLQITLTAYEALPTLPGNPLIEDRPLYGTSNVKRFRPRWLSTWPLLSLRALPDEV